MLGHSSSRRHVRHNDNEPCLAYSSSMNVHRGYDVIGQVFTDHFKAAAHSIFKLGVLQNYIGEDAGLSWRTWEAGKFDESMQLARSDPRYISWMRLCHESPASITRAQVVERPLTPYTAWELALFAEYQKQGAEKVYFTEAAHLLGKAALPDSDIVIFDDQRVLQWLYIPDSHGLVDGGTIWDAAEGDDISQFIALRQAVLDQA